MSYGPIQAFQCCIASGASTSSYIDLGKSYTDMALSYVTMSTGSVVSVFGCDTATGTYLPVLERVSTSSVQYQAVQFPTSVSGSWGIFKAPPFRYIEFCTTAVVSGGVSFTVICRD